VRFESLQTEANEESTANTTVHFMPRIQMLVT